MARSPRISPAGIPLHIVQRGNNRQACFRNRRDYEKYLFHLRETSEAYQVAVHAYVLMNNHVHMLVTPSGDHSVGGMMQALGRRYVRYFNDSYKRTGGLWEGRFRSCLVDSDRYLLACYRYIENNPVRAEIVETAADYEWSSYHANGLGEPSEIITPHADYLALAQFADERPARYQKIFNKPVRERELKEWRDALQGAKAYGSDRFKHHLERKLKVRLTPGKAGRPRTRPLPVEEKLSDGDARQQQSLL